MSATPNLPRPTRRRSRPAQTPPAVVVGLDSLQGLQAARILAARGVPVIGVAKDPNHHACRTNVCDEILIADTGGEGLVDVLRAHGPSFSAKPVLVPCQDKNVAVLSTHRARLEDRYVLLLPDAATVDLLMDKARFYEYAARNGHPIPPTVMLRTPGDLDDAAALSFPLIVKPSLRLRKWSRHTREKAVIVHDTDALAEAYARMRSWTDVLIAQELVHGPDHNHVTVNAYFDRDSRPLATATSQKLRQWPVGTGQACLSQTVSDPRVVDEADKLFRTLDYVGLAYLEMKQDSRTGEYLIIEPNVGRTTGRSAGAEAAGVELLLTMYRDAIGAALPIERGPQRDGVKWVHLVRDTQAAWHAIRRRQLTVPEWWRSLRGPRAYAIWSPRDPKPFVFALLKPVRKAAASVRLRRRVVPT